MVWWYTIALGRLGPEDQGFEVFGDLVRFCFKGKEQEVASGLESLGVSLKRGWGHPSFLDVLSGCCYCHEPLHEPKATGSVDHGPKPSEL